MEAIGMGLATLGMLGAAIGIGLIFGNAVTGISRNPSAEKAIFKTALIGAVFAELMGLLGFVVVIFLKFI